MTTSPTRPFSTLLRDSQPSPRRTAPPNVLLVLLDAQRCAWYTRLLENAGILVQVVSLGREAIVTVGVGKPDLIILGMDLPDVEGLGLLVRWRAEPELSDVPILLLPPASEYANILDKAIERGADDVVRASVEPAELVARARLLLRSRARTVQLRSRLSDAERRNSELESAALRDPLTGAYNRRYLEQRLVEEVYRAERHGQPLSVVMTDVDHFKSINDRFGHAIGDGILQGVAKSLRDAMRRSDVLARYGGEEFVIITPSTDLSGAKVLADRARARIATAPLLATTGSGLHAAVATTASFGVASLEACEGSETVRAAHLLERADAALYVAKRGGRNRVSISTGCA